MDQAVFALIIVGALLIVTFLVVIFLIPTSREAKRKKRKRPANEFTEEQFQKLEKSVKHLEGVNAALRKQIVSLESNDKNWVKKFAVEEAKVNKLKDKLLQERQWQDKEVEKYNKKAQEVQDFKNELKTVQDGLSAEHAKTIRLEGDIRDLKAKLSSINDERRALEIEASQLKAKLKATDENVRQLKKDKAELSKQKNDATFVAKSDYMELEQKLKETEKELNHYKNKKPS